MLDLAERITTGVCLFLVVVTIGWYLWWGTPSTTSAEFIPSVEKRTPTKPQGANPQDEPLPADEKAIVDNLLKQGVKLLPGRRLARDELTVPDKTLEYLSTEANWMPELHRVGSEPIKVGDKKTRLKIFEIEKDSITEKLGLKENDVIELVDNQIIEFSETNAARYHDLFKGAVKKLRQGQSVSITVTRNNQPLHIEFKL